MCRSKKLKKGNLTRETTHMNVRQIEETNHRIYVLQPSISIFGKSSSAPTSVLKWTKLPIFHFETVCTGLIHIYILCKIILAIVLYASCLTYQAFIFSALQQAPIIREGILGKKKKMCNHSGCTSVTSVCKSNRRKGHFGSVRKRKKNIIKWFVSKQRFELVFLESLFACITVWHLPTC